MDGHASIIARPNDTPSGRELTPESPERPVRLGTIQESAAAVPAPTQVQPTVEVAGASEAKAIDGLRHPAACTNRALTARLPLMAS